MREPAIESTVSFLAPSIGNKKVKLTTTNTLITPVKNKYGGIEVNFEMGSKFPKKRKAITDVIRATK